MHDHHNFTRFTALCGYTNEFKVTIMKNVYIQRPYQIKKKRRNNIDVESIFKIFMN